MVLLSENVTSMLRWYKNLSVIREGEEFAHDKVSFPLSLGMEPKNRVRPPSLPWVNR